MIVRLKASFISQISSPITLDWWVMKFGHKSYRLNLYVAQVVHADRQTAFPCLFGWCLIRNSESVRFKTFGLSRGQSNETSDRVNRMFDNRVSTRRWSSSSTINLDHVQPPRGAIHMAPTFIQDKIIPALTTSVSTGSSSKSNLTRDD